MTVALSPTAADAARAGVPFRDSDCTEITAHGLTDFPFEYFMIAAFYNLDEWVRTGAIPPKAPLMSLKKVPGVLLPVPEVDTYSNALGGVRSPYVDEPIAAYFGTSTPGNPASRLSCNLSGYKIPFTKEALAGLYPTHDAYVKKVSDEVDAMVKGRRLMPSDGRRIKDEAARTPVP